MTKITPEQWQIIKGTLADALEMPEQDQPALIEARCSGNVSVAEWVQLLLAHQGESDLAFLLTPPDFGPLAGTDIGRYRLQWRIGHGGFGDVYLATRHDPVIWRVAIKVLRPEYSSEAFRQRFEREMRVLSVFRHPGIVRLLDAGVTEQGQWYFAMEYVDGQPLTGFCSSRELPVRNRLNLFLQLCDAVQYAHNRCVIHCDLKPSNILVDEGGAMTLLDFGIARLLYPEIMRDVESLDHPLTEPVTLGYGSPEQFDGLRVTTSTDIYSLGAVLYELLTGCLPFATDGLSPSQFAEKICREDPHLPSQAAAIVSGTKRERELRGDLDSIALKALHRESERRYATVAQLAEDIRRYLTGFPVHARTASWSYRCRRFIGRHEVVAIALALVFISLVTGLSISLFQWNRAIAEHQKAERRLEEIGRIATVFNSALQRVESESPGDIRLLSSIASDFELLGDALDKSDDPADAHRAYEESESLYERVGHPESGQAVRSKLARLRGPARPFGFVPPASSAKRPGLVQAGGSACALADAYGELGQILEITNNAGASRETRQRRTLLLAEVARTGTPCSPKSPGPSIK